MKLRLRPSSIVAHLNPQSFCPSSSSSWVKDDLSNFTISTPHQETDGLAMSGITALEIGLVYLATSYMLIEQNGISSCKRSCEEKMNYAKYLRVDYGTSRSKSIEKGEL
jgi:hypothetical protein